MRGDHGRIVIGAITRIIGCLAIVVVLFHDGVTLGLGQVSADQDAQVAAQAGAQAYQQAVASHNAVGNASQAAVRERFREQDVQRAYDAAALAVAANGTEISPDSFRVDGSGMVTLTTTRRTSTMVADRFSWFDSLTNPTSTASAKLVPA